MRRCLLSLAVLAWCATAAMAEWRFAESEARFDASTSLTASLAAVDEVEWARVKSRPVFTIACVQEPRRAARIEARLVLGSGVFANRIKTATVRYRFDEQAAVTGDWAIGEVGDQLLHPTGGLMLAEAIGQARALVIEIEPVRDLRKLIRFDLAGSAPAMGRLARTCYPEMEAMPAGIHPKIRNDILTRGPRSIALLKRGLAALGYYDGTQDGAREPALFSAVQRFADERRAAEATNAAASQTTAWDAIFLRESSSSLRNELIAQRPGE